MQNSDEFKLNLNIAVTPVLDFTVAHVMNKKIIKKSSQDEINHVANTGSIERSYSHLFIQSCRQTDS